MKIFNVEDNINQLMQILQNQNKGNESEMIMLLVNQMREINTNYITILQELQDIKNQMNNQQSVSVIPEKQDVIVNQLTLFEDNIRNQYHQFQGIAQKFNDKAGILVQKFKDIGIKSLNNVCEFLNVKETLVKLKDVAQSNAVKMKNSIEKIDTIGNEVGNVVANLKNIGNAIADKPKVEPVSADQSKIFTSIKNHYQRNLEKFTNRVDKLSNAIEKINNIEKEANRASAQTSKTSIKEKLENNKALIEAKENSEPKPVIEKYQGEVVL